MLPPLVRCRSVVTIHDCIHLMFPQYLPNRLALGYARTSIRLAARRATRVLTVSESSKRDILRFVDAKPDKIDVIYNAYDERFGVEPREEDVVRVRERYQLHDEFVLYAGNVKPHKNLERLIEAFHLVRKRGLDHLKLVLIGDEISRYAALRRAVHQHQLHKYVRFLGYLPEDTLAVMYRLAGVFVFPSLYEGFGLPPLEAMASGTPVVTSNVSSLPEVAGDAAVLVDPYDPESIADGIYQRADRRNPAPRSAPQGPRARPAVFVGAVGPARPRDLRARRRHGVGRGAESRIALVHDWLTGMRGGEKALEVLCERFPDAELFTLVHVPGSVSPAIERLRPHTSFIQHLPLVRRYYRHYLPLFPTAIEQFSIRPLRPRPQPQPLLREVDRPAGPRAPCLLLPDADALRLGPVRRLFRPRRASARSAARPCGRSWRGWPAGTATRRTARTAMSLFLIMLRAGSADTIIARRLWCIRPSIPISFIQTMLSPSVLRSSCRRSCPTSASTSPSTPAAWPACR